MLQRLDDRMNAHNATMKLADRRALEKQAQHPQILGAGRMGKVKMGLEDTKFENEESESEGEKEMKGGASPESRLNRLVGGRRKPSASRVGKAELKAHKLAHEALDMEGGAKHSEAYLQGGALSKHLRELHGEGWWDDFKSGFMSVIKPIASIAKPILAIAPHPAAKAASAGLSALGLGKGERLMVEKHDAKTTGYGRRRGGKIEYVAPAQKKEFYKGGATDPITGATDNGRVANPPPSFARNTVGMGVNRHRVVESTGGEYADQTSSGLSGAGFLSSLGIPVVSDIAGIFGLGKEGAKKTRAKAGPNDARKRRGAAVSRLMKEKGMTLGEASKYVKEHGF